MSKKLRERAEIRNLLYGAPSNEPVYDPGYHPRSIREYFQKALDEVEEIERNVDVHGRLTYHLRPVKPPTIAAWALSVGVTRETVWYWGKRHTEFKEALGIAKAAQEQVFVTMGALGSYHTGFATMMMKNLQEWKDKFEAETTSAVTITFDSQDEEA